MNSPGIAISMVYPIMKTIVHKGYDTEQYCSYASFDASLLQDVEGRIAGEELERLMIAAASYTQDEYFGLHQGQITEFTDLGILGYMMMHSNKVVDALTAYQRYNVILCNSFNLNWEVKDEDVLIRISLQSFGLSRHCVEDMASSLYQLMGRLSNRRLPLQDVQFAHDAPTDINPYIEVFGLAPSFGEEDHILRFNKELLDYPVMYSDSRLLGMFEGLAKDMRDELTGASILTGQVLQWLEKCLPAYFPTLQQTAEYFGMSTRTLQNKLKEEDTSFNELSIRVRKELAMRYLRKSVYSIGEIAYVLHFSEPSAFQNAFKKWTGLTPRNYRAQAQARR